MPCVPPVEALPVVVFLLLVKALPVVVFLLVVAFLPVAFPSVEGFPPVVVLPVAVLVRLREVVVLFVEDEA